jgi:Predicted Zn-dependent protease (DUF2268)
MWESRLGRSWLGQSAVGVTLIFLLASCGAASLPTGAVTEHAAGLRFGVTITAAADKAASSVGVNLPKYIARTLAHISALLPGPSSFVTVDFGSNEVAGGLLPQMGVNGITFTVSSASIVVNFGPTAKVSVRRSLWWLQRDLAHEVDHTARMAGPGDGFGTDLLNEMMSEATASVFDTAAYPGPPDPFTQALTRSQECSMWTRERPLLYEPDPGGNAYDQWVDGGQGVLPMSLFTIGYHIAVDYLRMHPHTSVEALTALPAKAILDGSNYQPCRR